MILGRMLDVGQSQPHVDYHFEGRRSVFPAGHHSNTESRYLVNDVHPDRSEEAHLGTPRGIIRGPERNYRK